MNSVIQDGLRYARVYMQLNCMFCEQLAEDSIIFQLSIIGKNIINATSIKIKYMISNWRSKIGL